MTVAGGFTGLLVGGPVLGKVLGLQDTVIIMIGAASHAIARVIYATVLQPTGFYVGESVYTQDLQLGE